MDEKIIMNYDHLEKIIKITLEVILNNIKLSMEGELSQPVLDLKIEKCKTRGPKMKVRFQVYKDKQLKDTIIGMKHLVKYINKNFDMNVNANICENLMRCEKSDNLRRKERNYLKYNGVQIVKIR